MTAQEKQLFKSVEYADLIGVSMVQDDAGSRETSGHGVTDEENSKMQVIWDQAMCKEMEILEGYQNVAVLIIKWTEELDHVKSGDEVGQLY